MVGLLKIKYFAGNMHDPIHIVFEHGVPYEHVLSILREVNEVLCENNFSEGAYTFSGDTLEKRMAYDDPFGLFRGTDFGDEDLVRLRFNYKPHVALDEVYPAVKEHIADAERCAGFLEDLNRLYCPTSHLLPAGDTTVLFLNYFNEEWEK